MPKVQEVVCTLPFVPRRDRSYNFIVRGNLIVLESGTPKYDTKIAGDPDSHYRLEGRDVVRTFTPGRRERIEAARVRRAAIRESPEFDSIVETLEKTTKARAKRYAFETDLPDEEVEVSYVPDRGKSIEALARRALELRVIVFRTSIGLRDVIGVAPGADPTDLCHILMNVANVDVAPSRVIRALRSLRRDAPFFLHTVAPDRVEAKLSVVPTTLAEHASAIERLCADNVEEGDASKMLRARKLILWWD